MGSDIIQISDKAPESVLVVAGNILVRVMVCAYLRDCGFRVIEAANTDDATRVITELEPPVDVVLSEIEIPGTMDGFELARWVRDHRPSLPVMLVGSPAGAARAAGELCSSGPDAAQPYSSELLLQQIRRLLAEPKRPSDSSRGEHCSAWVRYAVAAL